MGIIRLDEDGNEKKKLFLKKLVNQSQHIAISFRY